MEHHHPIETGRVDELVAVLSDARRRTVLEYLRDTPAETVPLDDLARELPGSGAAGAETRLVLHHVTLPKLAETGVLEYDPDDHAVTYRGSEALETLLEEAGRLGDRLE